jgi:hypothetical protein
MRSLAPFALALVVALGAACSDPNQLPDATETNAVDTVTLSALTRTPLDSASGYSITSAQRVRTDLTSSFDFAYDLDTLGRHTFLPLAVLGVNTGSADPGLLKSDKTFDDILLPEGSGYTTDSVVVVSVGEVYEARSRVVCQTVAGTVPAYAKLEILGFNDSPDARTITFRVLANTNCGYRSLQPGIPRQ